MPDHAGEGIDDIRNLVDGFRTNLPTLRNSETSEAAIRQEYIDPFWEALGWDVRNRAHRSGAERDVVIEKRVGTVERERIRSRRPDYLFRIDGFPRFIVEAKRPGLDVPDDKEAIFQAKTYAWNAQIPFAVLIDFERFRLYDATIKPYHDAPSRGLVQDFDLRFEDYAPQWDVLTATFSRDAVAGGSLENLLRRIKHERRGRRIRGIDRLLLDLRGTEPVDRVFLAHLEDYRLRFARALYRENRSTFPDADTRHGAAKLTEATQRLLDRLVFMRVCEDRDITPPNDLRDTVNDAIEHRRDLYPVLVHKFRELDAQYNGYLFKHHFNEELNVPGELLRDFISSLYPPDGPYRFDLIGDDLLGIVYEKFLGSTITVRRSHVEAEDKPEVRHAGGVYYTPPFVVDTIIRRVIGPKLEGKTPPEVLNVKILDPACGSGSFLIAALQYLFDYCIRCVEEDPDAAWMRATPKARKRKKRIAFQDEEGRWHLAPAFRGRLLTSCIYGIDIDAQAVEVTVMSLYLKMLEAKLPENWQQEWLDERLLPQMDNNLRCGNSLLSASDFDRYWEDKHGSLFAGDEDTRFRINAFDWTSQTRGFGRVMDAQGGFDCIIGNPPYIRVQELRQWAPEESSFYKWRYDSARRHNYDIYVVFIERSLELLNEDGALGFICPHKFWQAVYGQGIRKIIADGRHLQSVIDFADQQVFRGSTTYTAIQVFKKTANASSVDYARIAELSDGASQCLRLEASQRFNTADISRWPTPHPKPTDPTFRFAPETSLILTVSPEEERYRLDDIAQLSQGFKTGADKVFVVEYLGQVDNYALVQSRETTQQHRIEPELLRPLIKSEHMRSFEIRPTRLMLLFPYQVEGDSWRLLDLDELKQQYPIAFSEYLLPLKSVLEKRERGRYRVPSFYRYSRQQNFVPLSNPKLITPDIADRMRVSFDDNGSCVFSGGGAGGNAIIPTNNISPLFLLGVLNSTLIENQVKLTGTVFRGGWLNCEIRFLRDIPIQLPRNAHERSAANQIAQLAQAIINAKKRLQAPRLSDREREGLERDVEAHESRIDELVCRLYGVENVPTA